VTNIPHGGASRSKKEYAGLLEADLEVSPDRQLAEHQISLFHRKRGLKCRLHRRQFPAPDECLKQLFLLDALS